ncbi:hypothetical protein RclHR1_24450002 [Rhizophagus clarus]|uniref:Retrotransposon gag domain-containing protein n=1 Tax=Rhizophagus clarus TaxID=94130 RepID=A0A2Z6RS21_9GLOM|nr:hypothetical protein RclHR1_24450002 [Rhizophagus clarus]GET04495.1 hypothetical protein GLOIN_2v1791382 [Rhizophagus clarus]
MFGHDIGNNWGALQRPANDVLMTIGNVGNAVGNLAGPVNRAAKIGDLPLYYGGEQDVHEWIRDFNTVFIANGYQEGNNQANKLQKARACMRGEAADWYEANKANIQRWHDNTHNGGANNLIDRLINHYVSDIRKSQWTRELQTMKQKAKESVGDYAARFKRLIRKVVPGANDLADRFKVTYFINVLNPMLIVRVMERNPANVQASINRAKMIESGNKIAMQALMNQNFGNVNVKQMAQNIVKEQKEEPKNIFDKPNKQINKKMEEITDAFAKMKASDDKKI